VAASGPVGEDEPVTGGADDTDPTRDDLQQRSGSGLSAQARLVVTVVLACAFVVAITAGVLLSLRYADTNGQAEASRSGSSITKEQQEREDVQAAVSAFVANLNSYSVKDIDGYQDRLKPLLTPGFAQSFDLAVENIVAQVKATNMTSEGEVLSTAVSSIDPNSATALVVADATVKSALGDRLRHFRWRVSLIKSEGTWLIDDFKPVGGAAPR